MENEKTIEEATNFDKVPEGGSEEVEAIKHIDGKTQFDLEPEDYAIICRGNGMIEQVIPARVEKDGCVENDMQAFFLYCALIWTSVEENENSRAIVQQVFAHAESMGKEDDEATN